MTRAQRHLIWCELREFYSPSEAYRWLNSPHPQLEDRHAVDCEFDEVMAIIDRLKSSAYL
jgi:uncharacterized protein (DUF2384 family)